jgi:hypothetical protein
VEEAVSVSEAYSPFQQPWWLEAVAPGRWGAVEVRSGDRIVARMPYVTETRFGLAALNMPKLTRELGPWLAPAVGKRVEHLAQQKEWMLELIAQLPRFDYFHQCFSPMVENWYPFFLRGYKQTTRYTFRLDDLRDTDALWAGLRDNMRRHVRKAEKEVTVRADLGIDRLIELMEMSYERQGKKSPVPAALIRRLDAACHSRGSRALLCAEDAQGRLHAASYFVADEHCTYWLMSGGNPELRNSGANSLLVWEGIKWASGRSRAFDFEGSMVEPIEKYLGGFGGRKAPYHSVSGASRKGQILLAARELARAVAGK